MIFARSKDKGECIGASAAGQANGGVDQVPTIGLDSSISRAMPCASPTWRRKKPHQERKLQDTESRRSRTCSGRGKREAMRWAAFLSAPATHAA